MANGMWSLIGLALALFVAAAALLRPRLRPGYYDADLYGMTARVHRRYGVISLLFALFFDVTYRTGASSAGVGGLAVYAVIAVFYAASFLRGASDADE
jgi:hypothetical protein